MWSTGRLPSPARRAWRAPPPGSTARSRRCIRGRPSHRGGAGGRAVGNRQGRAAATVPPGPVPLTRTFPGTWRSRTPLRIRQSGAPAVGDTEHVAEYLHRGPQRAPQGVLADLEVVQNGLRTPKYVCSVPELIRLDLVREPGQPAGAVTRGQETRLAGVGLPGQQPQSDGRRGAGVSVVRHGLTPAGWADVGIACIMGVPSEGTGAVCLLGGRAPPRHRPTGQPRPAVTGSSQFGRDPPPSSSNWLKPVVMLRS